MAPLSSTIMDSIFTNTNTTIYLAVCAIYLALVLAIITMTRLSYEQLRTLVIEIHADMQTLGRRGTTRVATAATAATADITHRTANLAAAAVAATTVAVTAIAAVVAAELVPTPLLPQHLGAKGYHTIPDGVEGK